MAERSSAKRDHPNGCKTSEAEAKPSHSPATSASKRMRIEEENEGSPAADSTTVNVRDEDGMPSENARGLCNSGSEVDQMRAPEPLREPMLMEEDGPSSTSENNPLPNKNKTGSCVQDSHSPGSSDSQLINASSRNFERSEAVSTMSVDRDTVGRPQSGFEKNGPEQGANGTSEPDESLTGCSRSCDSQAEVQRVAVKADDARDCLGQTLQPDLAVATSAKPDGMQAPGASSDGQGSGDARGEGVPRVTATQKEPLKGLREVDVGISEYISTHKGFHGVIKQRYQDFLVNEVDNAGQVVHLTDMTSPDPPEKISINIDEVLSSHDQQRLRELSAASDKQASHCIEVESLDKDQRKKIHEVIRQDFVTLESCTLDGDGKKVIKVTKVIRGGRKQRSNWDKTRPNFCRFVMHKENMEVNDALTLISKYSHVKHQSFGFSGTKDKRAVTVQEVTVYRVEAERLIRLNSILRGIRLGNFRYVEEPLALGNHTGNHFVIILRDVDGAKDEIDHALTSMRDMGFINYFGMQRFGNSQVATHLVGRAVLHSNWQEAVDLILKPREGNTQDNRWRQLWMETRDPKAVLDILPKHKTISIEMQLLKGLVAAKKNYFQGLQCIPRNVRLLYVHSYQSYVWNVLVSRRIQKYGLKVIAGDLILKPAGDESEPLQSSVVDEGCLDSYSIQDIVLPLPGYTVQYPQNELGDWYSELLSRDDLDIKNMRHQVKDYSLPGTYRKIVVKPDNVSWSVLPYSNTNIPLTQSDLDRLEGKKSPTAESDGNLRALRLEFTLSTCCYATMAIREILKIDTSAAHQSNLNPVQQTESNNSATDLAEAETI